MKDSNTVPTKYVRGKSSNRCIQILPLTAHRMSPLMLMLQMELPFQDLLYSSGEVALFTLAIPDRLLHEWYRNSTPLPYTELVNSKIRGKMCSLKTCSRLNEFKHATLQGRLVKPGVAKGSKFLIQRIIYTF